MSEHERSRDAPGMRFADRSTSRGAPLPTPLRGFNARRHIGLLLWLCGLALTALWVRAQHVEARRQGKERNARYALLLTHHVWNLDRASAVRTMQLIADAEQYELVSIELEGGQLFARFPEHEPVAPSGLLSQVDHFVTPIVYDGEVLGTLTTRGSNQRLLYYALQVFVLVLAGVLVQVSIQNVTHRRALERLKLHDEITLREEVEVRLLQRERELRKAQRLEALGQVAGGVAHDFNNLLTVIVGRIQLARKEATDALAMHLDGALAAADRAQTMAQQLLAFGRPAQHKPTDLNAVIDRMKDMLRHLLPEHIALDIELTAGLPLVRGDAGELEQVVLNLVVNARDAMPNGGTVRVRTAPSARGNAPPGGVTLCVEDTGIGMSREVQSQLFAPFFTTKLVGEGTGLGLATVKRIVEQSGGTLALESAPGEGTKVTVTLSPAELTHEDAAPTDLSAGAASREPPKRRAARVLVVEDDPELRLFVREGLEACGCEVQTARDPEDALRILQLSSEKVDLVLADLAMPRMDGPTLRRRARECEVEVPFVFIRESEASDKDLAHDIMLTRPFTSEELCGAVQRGLERKEKKNVQARVHGWT